MRFPHSRGDVPSSSRGRTGVPKFSPLAWGCSGFYVSDATLIIARKVARAGAFHEELTGGTLRTERFAIDHAKPRLVIFSQKVEAVLAWLSHVAAQLQREDLVLNVAGPRESKCPGIEQATCAFVKRLIARVQEGAAPLKQ